LVTHRDFSSSQVDTLEAVEERDTGSGSLFNFVGVAHHGNLLSSVVLSEARRSGGESHQGLLGILGPALLDQPVGAKAIPMKMGIGQTNCTAKGIWTQEKVRCGR
jgi:hypothetical protein